MSVDNWVETPKRILHSHPSVSEQNDDDSSEWGGVFLLRVLPKQSS